MFAKACEYGIKAITYIATQSLDNNRVKIGDVAKKSGSPEAFTAKILSKLTKNELISSIKGPLGGFEIDLQTMKQTKLSDIVFAIDGDSIYNGCALGLSECNEEEPCPMHDQFVKVRRELKDMLDTTTIYDLAAKLKSGKSILTR